ncbi:MAG: aldehyde dehydrogenase family protein [Candidatus Helarchaeota archaeon]
MNLVNGKYVEPLTGKYFEDLNPADNTDIIGIFPRSGSDDIKNAVRSAKEAFPAWRDLPPPKRGDLIYKLGELLLKNQEKLAKIIVREMGKTLPESMGDIQSSADVAYFAAGEGRRMYGQTTYSAQFRKWAITKRVPVGVCGLITAWNAPMAIITWKLLPAVICGNTVVLKPSEDTPLTAHMFGELIKEAGFPDGVINIIYGMGPETGEALVKEKDVDLISFTGSTKVGRKISEECGRQMKKCSLELGGKNGLVVMDDADLNAAADAVARGAFSTAGQRCASTSRAFIHEEIYDDFLKLLIEETKKMKVGVGTDPNTKVCPIINKKQFTDIMGYIKGAKKDGATLLYGGNALTEGEFSKGYFIEPTIFENVDLYSKLAQEEIFGPVLAVFKINSLAEAIEKVNSVKYGLTASIFTSNMRNGLIAMEKFEVGCCYVNAPTFGSEPHMPFGGVKDSGNGQREPGTQSLDVFSEWKTIYLNYS